MFLSCQLSRTWDMEYSQVYGSIPHGESGTQDFSVSQARVTNRDRTKKHNSLFLNRAEVFFTFHILFTNIATFICFL